MNLRHNPILAPALLAGFPLLAAVAVTSVSLDAHAASDCFVTSTVDDGDPGSLRHCVDELNSGLYSAIVFTTSGLHELDYPLVIEKSMDWQGNGAQIAPSAAFTDATLIEVDNKATWSASDLTFDGNGITKVRAIHMLSSNSTAALDNVQIDGFDLAGLPDGDGGGIRIDGATVSLLNADISGCKANDGGGIAVFGGKVTLIDSSLGSNEALQRGGGVYGSPASGSSISLDVVQAFGNSADTGGAIFSEDVALEATEVFFDSNDAMESGGAIHGSGHVTLGVFIQNTATGSGGGDSRGGGAFHASGPVKITKSYFAGNQAADGGALKANDNDLFEVDQTAIFDNTAWGQEGASAISIVAAEAYVTNTTISGNSSTDTAKSAAAIMPYGGTLELVHVTVAENTSFNTVSGLIVPVGVEVDVKSSLFANTTNPAIFECAIASAAQFTQDSSMAHGRGCQGFARSTTFPVQACSGPGDFTYGCDPISPPYTGVCRVANDQRGVPRAPGGICQIGAIEGT